MDSVKYNITDNSNYLSFMHWKKLLNVSALAIVIGLWGCGDGKKGSPVTQTEFGSEWPLTVAEGRLYCIWFANPRRPLVTFFTPDGKEYSLNGNASESGYFLPVEGIQKPHPVNPSGKMSLVPLIKTGLKFCPGYSEKQ
mgnify:CR=1 FL=1